MNDDTTPREHYPIGAGLPTVDADRLNPHPVGSDEYFAWGEAHPAQPGDPDYAEILDAEPVEKKLLTLVDVEEAHDLKTGEVDVPEWGGTVTVRGLNHNEFTDVRKAATDEDGELDDTAFTTSMLIHGLVQPQVDADTVQILFRKAAGPVTRITIAILKCSGLDKDSAQGFEAYFREDA